VDPLTALSLGIGVLKLAIWGYGLLFSDSAVLRRLQTRLAAKEAQLVLEKAKLAATNTAIDAAPDKTGTDLVDDLNRRFGKRP
jgi:hypothetical protein